MQIALTGATGFLGRYILNQLTESGHEVRALFHSGGHGPYSHEKCTWVEGSLENPKCFDELLDSCEAVVHAALWHPGKDWSGGSKLNHFLEVNMLGSINLAEAAVSEGVEKFVYISSCAVHDKILSDRPLDENHPLFARTHYGAHKAAVEAFVHSIAAVSGFDICAIRPCGIYGLAEPVEDSQWYEIIKSVVKGSPVKCSGGGKEVHAADVARAVELLLKSKGTAGEVYNCCDRYISAREIADIALAFTESGSEVSGERTSPKNTINTQKLQALGMQFGGEMLLRDTVGELIAKISEGGQS